MTVKQLIAELQQCNQDDEITAEFTGIQAVAVWPDGVVLELESKE